MRDLIKIALAMGRGMQAVMKTYSRVGLRNVVFAVMEDGTDLEGSAPTYGTVKASVEAIDVQISHNNADPDVQYADDVESDVLYPDPEIKMTLEVKELPLADQATMLGHTIDSKGVMVEKADPKPPYLAMGFKSKKRNGKDRYVWYLKGRAAPLEETYHTEEGKTITRQTDKVVLTFIKRTFDSHVSYKVDEDNPSFADAKATFFDAPYVSVPAAPGP